MTLKIGFWRLPALFNYMGVMTLVGSKVAIHVMRCCMLLVNGSMEAVLLVNSFNSLLGQVALHNLCTMHDCVLSFFGLPFFWTLIVLMSLCLLVIITCTLSSEGWLACHDNACFQCASILCVNVMYTKLGLQMMLLLVELYMVCTIGGLDLFPYTY